MINIINIPNKINTLEQATDLINALMYMRFNVSNDIELIILDIWKRLASIPDDDENTLDVFCEKIPDTDINKLYIVTSYENKCKLLGPNCSFHFEMTKNLKKLGFTDVIIVGAHGNACI